MSYVDWKQSVSLVGTVLKYLGVVLLIPLVTALIYREDILVFAVAIVVTTAIGYGLERLDPETDLGPREALLFVTLSWIAVSVIGSLPYLIAGIGTESTLAHPVNALFESTSGFTTTGATVIEELSYDRHSRAILLWRQLTQWLGGMGIIVLMVAIFSELAVNGAQLIASESPGPDLQKLTPKIARTARILWLVYIGFTVLLIGLLYGLHLMGIAPQMSLFNAVSHGLSTLPTGGFSPEADSIAAFEPVVQWVIIPFMVIAGTNFALFYYLLNGDISSFIKDPEFKVYIGAITGLVVILTGVLFWGGAPELARGGVTNGVPENALRQAAFQIGSLLNSTGFATSNFASWETPAQLVLLTAMFIGGSAGSTGGGIKVVRWLIVLKVSRRELFTTAHPEAVKPIRLGRMVVDETAVRSMLAFTLVYLILFIVGAGVIAIDTFRVGLSLSVLEILSASLATLGNIGPGFGSIGPFGSYLQFPDTSKLVMIFLMWVGRLEIIPVLVLLTPGYWNQ